MARDRTAPPRPPTFTLPAPAARRRFRTALLTWYRAHGRQLPWRETDDPYHILVSEVMLQQTQVDRVLPKYHEWLERYPTLEALAAAQEDDVAQTWRPLGYNIRPKRLQWIAREAVARFDGALPSDEATLLSFKGLGRYTVGAIRSFAFRQRAAILDTNVARVLFRVFLGTRRSEEPRDEAAAVGAVGDARSAQARLRLQSGADGFRGDAVHGSQAAVPALSDALALRRSESAGLKARHHKAPVEAGLQPRESSDPRRRRRR